jgi:RNA polymerase sigma-70 factor (ECF subfamily)
MPSDRSDDALMAAYAAGDRRAFDDLFSRLAPRLLHFFIRRFRDRSLADDLVQNTFVKVHRARHEYREDLPVRPWLLTIAARVGIDEVRKKKNDAFDDFDANEAAQVAANPIESPAEDALDRRNRAARVHAALDRLPDEQREVIHLHRFEGLSFREIGEALNISEGAAKLRAFRGYEKLRAQLFADAPAAMQAQERQEELR